MKNAIRINEILTKTNFPPVNVNAVVKYADEKEFNIFLQAEVNRIVSFSFYDGISPAEEITESFEYRKARENHVLKMIRVSLVVLSMQSELCQDKISKILNGPKEP